nr:AAA family ATPase [Acidobacteriota bacterium]
MQLINESEKAATLDSLQDSVARLEAEIAKVIVGQREVVRQLMVAVASGGHCLLRGVPGLAKTLLVKTLAEALSLRFNRIQFTPDLMPSDITGTEVIEEDRNTGRREGRFINGPIFANIVLADEINRAPPKTQAALLEAMQENQVTAGGVRYQLDRPFFVLATENPIEQEGTYHLPEAQLDRFLFEIVIDYPAADEERQIIAQTTANRTTDVRPVLDAVQLLRIQEVVRDVQAASNIID